MRDMMHRLIDSFAAAYLEPMTRSELYRRMCMNLVCPSCPQRPSAARTQALSCLAWVYEMSRAKSRALGSSAHADHLMHPGSK